MPKSNPENNAHKAVRIRYIKLGESGAWWPNCREAGLIRLGFATGVDHVYQAALKGRWKEIHRYWSGKCRTPTHHTNQTRDFFEDDGETLWVTFEDGCLYYAFSDGTPPVMVPDAAGSVRPTDDKGWRNVDAKGQTMRLDQLSTRLTKTQGYRMTICRFSVEVEQYLRRRLAAEENPALLHCEEAKKRLLGHLEGLIRSLTWQDFEVLVELIFAQSGLRRVSRTGGTKKTTDIDLENIVTGETAFVQVKSQTSNAQLRDYVARKASELGHVDRMYYVYHTGSAQTDAEDVVVWDNSRVAEQALSAGLLDWVLARSK